MLDESDVWNATRGYDFHLRVAVGVAVPLALQCSENNAVHADREVVYGCLDENGGSIDLSTPIDGEICDGHKVAFGIASIHLESLSRKPERALYCCPIAFPHSIVIYAGVEEHRHVQRRCQDRQKERREQ